MPRRDGRNVIVEPSTLVLFGVAVLALFVTPGPNMAFVLSHSLAHGPRAGFAAALGISAGDLVLTLLTATGVTAAIAAWPPSFDLLRIGGALYLVWMAWRAIRAPEQAVVAKQAAVSMMRLARMSMLNSLLNPKALLFFIVFLPQFVDPSRGHVTAQLAIFGVTLSAVALIYNTLLGLFSGRIGALLQRSPRVAKVQAWFLACVLAGLALRLLWLDRPLR